MPHIFFPSAGIGVGGAGSVCVGWIIGDIQDDERDGTDGSVVVSRRFQATYTEIREVLPFIRIHV